MIAGSQILPSPYIESQSGYQKLCKEPHSPLHASIRARQICSPGTLAAQGLISTLLETLSVQKGVRGIGRR